MAKFSALNDSSADYNDGYDENDSYDEDSTEGLLCSNFNPGELMVFQYIGYDHWAVYAGDDMLIHYQPKQHYGYKGTVKQESIQQYWKRKKSKCYPEKEPSLGIIESNIYCPKYCGDEVVRRASQYLGRGNYKLFSENCEHFAKWCKYGVIMSKQAQKVGLGATTTTAAWTGFLIGAAIGSFVPGIGNLIGGTIGATVGVISGVVVGGPGAWAANQVVRKVKSNKHKF